MLTVFDLWLPILLSGLATHILSTLAWMVLPHHKTEWKKLPVEDELYKFLGDHCAKPEQYIFPYAGNGQEAQSEEYRNKSERFRGTLVLWNSPTNMGKAIGLTIVTFITIAFVIGYLASLGLTKETESLRVMQFVTTAGLLAYVAANFPHVFWFRRKVAMEVLDGVIFAFTTGLIFALMWPR